MELLRFDPLSDLTEESYLDISERQKRRVNVRIGLIDATKTRRPCMKKRTKVCGNANVVGRRIEELRLEKGIRQNTFIAKLQASGLDINPTSYSKLEGQFRSASDVEIYHIAKELGVHVETLFSDYNPESR